MNGEFNRFVARHKCYAGKEPGCETHTAFNGGKYKIPMELYGEMLSAYHRDVTNGTPLYLNELRTAIFAFFVDLDMEHDKVPEPEDLQRLAFVITNCLKRFYPKATHEAPHIFTSILSTAEPKPLENGRLKIGVHINFPNIHVESHHAILMQSAIVIDCRAEFGDKFAPEDWENVVDRAVYMNSGLRMLFSRKAKKCTECKKKGNECYSCHGNYYIDQGRPYAFVNAFEHGVVSPNLTEQLQRNPIQLLRKCCIRTASHSITPIGWEKVHGLVGYEIRKTASGTISKKNSRSQNLLEDEQSLKSWGRKISVVDAEIHAIFLKAIRTRFIREYENLTIRKSGIKKDERQYYIQVEGYGSNICQNLVPLREHNNNTIWFYCNPQGITQKCFCRCQKTEGRRKGYCSKFSSVFKELSAKEMGKLFPKPVKRKHTSLTATVKPDFLESMNMDLFG